MIAPELEQAYRQTTYWVELPTEWIPVRIGKPHPSLFDFAEPWAIITADNPASDRRTPAENARRRQSLAADLRRYRCHPSYAVGDDRSWPPEIGFFVVGISRAEAVEVARRHGQNAIVAGTFGEPPRLVLCAPC